MLKPGTKSKMRTSKISRDEIEATQKAADERRKNRTNGFSMMKTRDQGAAMLSNGIVFEWPVKPEDRENGVAYTGVPEGHFSLRIGGKNYLFDADEFQKWIRWV